MFRKSIINIITTYDQHPCLEILTHFHKRQVYYSVTGLYTTVQNMLLPAMVVDISCSVPNIGFYSCTGDSLQHIYPVETL